MNVQPGAGRKSEKKRNGDELMNGKNKVRLALSMAISIHGLTACVSSDPLIVKHVSTSHYKDHSCEALFEEILKTEEEIPALKHKQTNINNKNKLLYGGGLLGALLWDKEGVKPELGEAMGEYLAVEAAWVEKGCQYSDFSEEEGGP